MPIACDAVGKRYGRLTALAFVGHRQVGSQRKRVWRLRCDCGTEVELAYSAFTTGNTRSCGCLATDAHTTHGGASMAIYGVWHSMVERCRNPNTEFWRDYGGRGIVVCERWQDFAAFRDDMGPRPDGATLERNEVDGNYEPNNCRWASPTDQANNRRNNRQLTLDGRTLTAAQWARERGLSKSCLVYRLSADWPLRDALSWPSDHREQHHA